MGAVQKTTWLLAFAVAAGACIGVWALTSWSDRRTVLDAAEASLAATARLLEQHADRALEAGDRIVQAGVEAASGPAGLLKPGRAEALHHRLRQLVDGNPQVASLWAMDASGVTVAESWAHPPATAGSFGHRPYFQAHRNGEAGLKIGAQSVGTTMGRPRFTLSRPVLTPEGAFAGVVAGGVVAEYFGAVYAEAGLGEGARLALFRGDGARLASWPPAGSDAAFPDLPEPVPPPGQSLLRVAADGRLTAIRHLTRYPVVLVVSQPTVEVLAEWRQRMWRNGAATAAAVCTLAALTLLGLRGARHERALMRALRRERGELEQRVAERTAALAESEARFRAMADHAPVMIYVVDAAGRCLFLSRSWYDFTGQVPERALGTGWLDALHPEDRPAADAAFAAAMERQAPFRLEYRIRRAADGAWRWALDAAAPRRDAGGAFLGYVGSLIDITERREAEERQALMARELDHRAKNALTVVQAALRLTPRHDAGSYAVAVEGRVAALARAHSVLAQGRWQGVALRALVEAELATFLPAATGAAPRAVLEGPDLMLSPTAVQALSMALHELATNAVKYGALSAPSGRLTVAWQLDQAGDVLRLGWTERGGPAPAGPPSRSGFGSRVVRATVEGQLGGRLERRWEAAGLTCLLTLPLPRLLAPGAGPPPAAPAEKELALAEG
jgi:PAS domain S-box-containing protein